MTPDSVPRARRGMGAMIAFVMIVLLIAALMGFSSQFQASGTGRTIKRVLDLRTALEAGESAIGEAVTYVRVTMASGATADCSTDWRAVLLAALDNGGPLPRGSTVSPNKAKDVFARLGLAVSDVRIDVIDVYQPPPPADPSQSYALDLPQGVLEFTVEVGSAQRLINVKKVMRQRRMFYVTAPVNPDGSVDSTRRTFFLQHSPLGTVIDQP